MRNPDGNRFGIIENPHLASHRRSAERLATLVEPEVPGSRSVEPSLRSNREAIAMSELKGGSCLCGRVSFTVAGDLRAPDACHCIQCRKQSGHLFASTNVPRAALVITAGESLSGYQSSAKVRRGFCSTCGSSLFWDPPERDWMAVAMGAFDAPTSTHLERHIFVAEKGDYYEIADDLPQSLRY